MAIPYYIFLIIYLLAVLIFFALSVINFYHIIRFGYFRFASVFITFLYLGAVVVIILLTLNSLSNIDWRTNIEFGNYEIIT